MNIRRILPMMLTMMLTLMLTLMLLLASTAPALAKQPPQIRVLLAAAGANDEFTIRIDAGDYDIEEAQSGRFIAAAAKGDVITFAYRNKQYYVSVDGGVYQGDQPLIARAVDEDARFSLNSNSYRGSFSALINSSYFYAVNSVDLELYLYGVVGRELGYNFHSESTRAQAVAARSYALASISDSNKFYDVTATISSQVYGGYAAESEHIRRAVDDTYGMALEYDGEAVMAYFSANAGGYTENIENVWNTRDVPLSGVPSPYDARAGSYSSYGASCYSWSVEYTAAELVSLANAYGKTDIGSFKGITMSTSDNNQRSVSNRAMIVTISGSKGSVSAGKDSIRSLLDLKSTLITISDNASNPAAAYVIGAGGKLVAWEKLKDLFATGLSGMMRANGENDTIFVRSAAGVEEISKTGTHNNKIVISGKGYGHGVGMSQWGAIAMGDDGYSWEEIIEHYYCGDGIMLESFY